MSNNNNNLLKDEEEAEEKEAKVFALALLSQMTLKLYWGEGAKAPH